MFEFITDETIRNQAIEFYNSSLAEANDKFRLKLDEEVSGLKSKNAEILDEKKKSDARLKELEAFDFEKAKEALSFLENNKDAQLIKDGRVDELIAKKTSQLTSDFEAQMGEVKQTLTSEKSRGDLYENLYKTKMVEDSLREAAIVAKARPEAITDILLHGTKIFSLAEDGSVEARTSDGKLRKTVDDKVLTPSNWIDGLKKQSPHYWPDSVGAGARGPGGMDEGDLTAALQRAAASGNMSEYRRLRKKQQQG
jgi:hypothetical protein